jgi:hypothetical protein
MGVLSDGTPYLNQRGLGALCGVQNAHIGTISSQWNEPEQRPRITAIKAIPAKAGLRSSGAHIEIEHKNLTHYCYPAEICLAILEYYAFDAGPNCQQQARDNYRLLAGSKWCYPLVALGAYRAWLQDTYIEGGKFSAYIRGKVSKGELPVDSAVGDFGHSPGSDRRSIEEPRRVQWSAPRDAGTYSYIAST